VLPFSLIILVSVEKPPFATFVGAVSDVPTHAQDLLVVGTSEIAYEEYRRWVSNL